MREIVVDGASLTLADIVDVARHGAAVAIAPAAAMAINKSRECVEALVAGGRTVYGVNTGFGEFANVVIAPEEVAVLQKNLLRSHACGVGHHLPDEVVRAVMLLRINALAAGFSGIRLEVLQCMADMLNAGVHPAIPEKGSLGASGDLAPLAHMALPVIGLGDAYFRGQLMTGGEAMALAGISPVELGAKEGLALINGTQVMTAIGALTLYDAKQLAAVADVAAALTMEALNGITDAYSPALQKLRPHLGQKQTAAHVLKLLEGSGRTTRQGVLRVQDAYSLRCVPQIHGASRDAIAFVEEKVLIEANSVTDNPIVFSAQEAISGGNFHGQPVALAFDFLAIALAELASVSERRVERLVNPALSRLPAFLTTQGGLNSGFMIMQYTAAALVSENKVLAHPASVDSIPSSAGQEDHVSMGTIAARKAAEVKYNLQKVLAIEILCACQAIDLNEQYKHKPLGRGTAAVYKLIRRYVPKVLEDRELYPDIDCVSLLIDTGAILHAIALETMEVEK